MISEDTFLGSKKGFKYAKGISEKLFYLFLAIQNKKKSYFEIFLEDFLLPHFNEGFQIVL